jgi:predicted transcriptional regulator
VSNEGKPWSTTDVDTLQEMMAREMTADQIAEELKRGTNETDAKMREYE